MESEHRKSPLYEMEMEVLAEGREWMRRRYEQKLRERSDQQGRISPPEPSDNRPLPPDANSVEERGGGGGS